MFEGLVSSYKRISGRNQRHQVTSIQKTEAMRAVAGRRDWKAGLGKFLLNKHKQEWNSHVIQPKRAAQTKHVLTLKPDLSHLSHRQTGSLWVTRTLSSYRVWHQHIQNWRCWVKTVERPAKYKQRNVKGKGQSPEIGPCGDVCMFTLYLLTTRRQRELERILSCLTWLSMWMSSGLWTWWAKSMGVWPWRTPGRTQRHTYSINYLHFCSLYKHNHENILGQRHFFYPFKADNSNYKWRPGRSCCPTTSSGIC